MRHSLLPKALLPKALLPKTLLLLIFAGLLAACGGGSVNTTENPDLNSDDGAYTGPSPRTSDIRSFKLNFWDFLSKDNRCGQCHGDSQSATGRAIQTSPRHG
jgi:hypothetical protein